MSATPDQRLALALALRWRLQRGGEFNDWHRCGGVGSGAAHRENNYRLVRILLAHRTQRLGSG